MAVNRQGERGVVVAEVLANSLDRDTPVQHHGGVVVVQLVRSLLAGGPVVRLPRLSKPGLAMIPAATRAGFQACSPFPGDSDPRRRSPGLAGQFAGLGAEFIAVKLTERQAAKWRRQVDELHRQVRAWSGNPLQVIEMSSYEWADHGRRDSSLFREIKRDAVEVAADPATTFTGPVTVSRTGAG